MPEANLTKKEPKSQQKKKNRKQKRKFVNEVNEQLAYHDRSWITI